MSLQECDKVVRLADLHSEQEVRLSKRFDIEVPLEIAFGRIVLLVCSRYGYEIIYPYQ